MVVQIKKSQRLMQARVFLVSVMALLIVIFISQILRFLGGFIEADVSKFGILVRVIVIVVALAAVFATWIQDRYEKYMIEGEKLIITRGFMAPRKQIITLSHETVSSVNLKQTFLGGMLNYGSVQIEVNNFGGKEAHILKNINDPHKALSEVEEHMKLLRQKA